MIFYYNPWKNLYNIVLFLMKVHNILCVSYTILHTSDIHSRFSETTPKSTICTDDDVLAGVKCLGGFGRLKHVLDRERVLDPQAFYVDVGNIFHGSIWYSVQRGQNVTSKMMKFMNLNVSTLGIYEFHEDPFELRKYVINLPETKFVLTNVELSEDLQKKIAIKKSYIKQIGNINVAFVGCVPKRTPYFMKWARSDIKFVDPVEALKNEIHELRQNQKVDHIILLSHVGYEEDKKLAKQVAVDIIVGGYSRTFLFNSKAVSLETPEGPYPTVIDNNPHGRKVLIVHAYAFCKYLGKLKVTLDSAGMVASYDGQPILLEHSIPKYMPIVNALEKMKPVQNIAMHKVIGKTRVMLDGNRQKCQREECSIANMMTDALVGYIAFSSLMATWTSHPIGIIEGGSIFSSIYANDVTYYSIIKMFPYTHRVITLTIKGSFLKRMLVASLDSRNSRMFLQFSGIRVTYDLGDNTVPSIKVRCGSCDVPEYSDLNPNIMYNIVTTEEIYNGGYDYTTYAFLKNNAREMKFREVGPLDVVEWYFATKEPVFAEVEGRIKFVEYV